MSQCFLHYLMGSVDRAKSDRQFIKASFNKIKLGILAATVFIVSIVAFSLVMVENKGVDNYTDEEDLKFERRHSVKQMRRMQIALILICTLLNVFFCRNFAMIVTNSNRSPVNKGFKHTLALVFSIICILVLLSMVVVQFFQGSMNQFQYL